MPDMPIDPSPNEDLHRFITAATDGDEEAIVRVLEEAGRHINSVLWDWRYFIDNSMETRDEFYNDILSKVWINRSSFRDAFRAWVSEIAENHMIDKYRRWLIRRKRHKIANIESEDEIVDEDTIVNCAMWSRREAQRVLESECFGDITSSTGLIRAAEEFTLRLNYSLTRALDQSVSIQPAVAIALLCPCNNSLKPDSPCVRNFVAGNNKCCCWDSRSIDYFLPGVQSLGNKWRDLYRDALRPLYRQYTPLYQLEFFGKSAWENDLEGWENENDRAVKYYEGYRLGSGPHRNSFNKVVLARAYHFYVHQYLNSLR